MKLTKLFALVALCIASLSLPAFAENPLPSWNDGKAKQREEIKRARRKPTENLDAYDYYLRGLASVRRWTRETNNEALLLFRKAIELDPGLACAYGMAGSCYIQRKARHWMIDPAQESAEATRLGRKAVHLGADDPAAMCMGAYVLAFIAHEFDDAIAFVDRGLAINPNLAQAWNVGAWVRAFGGEPDLALDYAARAMRLSPIDPAMHTMHAAVSYAHFLSGRYDMVTAEGRPGEPAPEDWWLAPGGLLRLPEGRPVLAEAWQGASFELLEEARPA